MRTFLRVFTDFKAAYCQYGFELPYVKSNYRRDHKLIVNGAVRFNVMDF